MLRHPVGNPRLRIATADAARLVEDLAGQVTIAEADSSLYRDTIRGAPGRGVRGGLIYDALHAAVATAAGCTEIRTLNVSHFRHVAPELTVLALDG